MNDQKLHLHVKCPLCGAHPPRGKYWTCVFCKHNIDPFILGICLICEKDINKLQCIACQQSTDIQDWYMEY